MSNLDDVAERDGWRCWLCDEPVDAQMSVHDPRGPSVDSRTTAPKGKAARATAGDQTERLAHRGCNTKKGAIAAVIPWPSRLFVADPAPLIGVVDRLSRKGGREVVGRCPTAGDADETAAWLVDRISRLAPTLNATTTITPGGGQFLVALSAPPRR
jgi:hypothetical protein